MAKKWKYGIGLFIIIIVVGIMVAFWLFVMGGFPKRIRNVEEYRKWDEYSIRSGLSIFPEILDKGIETDYFLYYRDNMFNATCEIYLKVAYNKVDYEEECFRLKNIQNCYQEEVQTIRYDEVRFNYPCYTAVFETGSYEYALLDEENNEIIYVYLQALTNPKISKKYLPLNYTNELKDYSSNYNIYSFDGYLVYPEE